LFGVLSVSTLAKVFEQNFAVEHFDASTFKMEDTEFLSDFNQVRLHREVSKLDIVAVASLRRLAYLE